MQTDFHNKTSPLSIFHGMLGLESPVFVHRRNTRDVLHINKCWMLQPLRWTATRRRKRSCCPMTQMIGSKMTEVTRIVLCRNCIVLLHSLFVIYIHVCCVCKNLMADQKSENGRTNWLCLDKLSTHFSVIISSSVYTCIIIYNHTHAKYIQLCIIIRSL